MFWFLLFSSFDATYLFQYTFVLLYNLIFTSLPVGILGAFDQDTNAQASMAFPQLYKRGIQGLDYTRTRFWLYMLDGLYQSAIIFFIPFLVYWDGTTWSSVARDTNDLYDLSSCIAASGVFAANLYVGINTRYWTIIPAIVIPISILAVFVWIAVYSYMASFDYLHVVEIIFPTFTFWFTVFFTVSLAVGPHWLLKAFRQSYFPRDKDIIREAWIDGDLKEQLGVKHRNPRKNRHMDVEGAHYPKRTEVEGYGAPPPTTLNVDSPLLEVKGCSYPNTSDSPAPSPTRATSSPFQSYRGQPPPTLTFDAPTQDTHTHAYPSAQTPSNPYDHDPYGGVLDTYDDVPLNQSANSPYTPDMYAPQPTYPPATTMAMESPDLPPGYTYPTSYPSRSFPHDNNNNNNYPDGSAANNHPGYAGGYAL
jgi:phospholipid-translocating ATPase